jgi:hypothetical protein
MPFTHNSLAAYAAGTLAAALTICFGHPAAANDDLPEAPTPIASITVNEGDPIHLVIPVTNPYDRGWRIEQVDLSCPCYELFYDDPLFAPLETREMKLVAESDNVSGTQNHRAFFYASDPDLSMLQVNFAWTVRPRISVDRLPDGSTQLQRPDDVRYRDIYLYQADMHPDAVGALQRNILIQAGAGRQPEDAPLSIQLPSEIPSGPWTFTLRDLGNETFLLAARGNATWAHDGNSSIISQELALTSNDPVKKEFTLKFTSFIREPE